MKKPASQISVALVCAFLGFLLAYQFKVLSKNNKSDLNSVNSDVVSEVESLKKEKEELTATNAELTEKLKSIEENATEKGQVEKEVKNQLDSARMQLGLVDVKGQGVIIDITPKNSIFNASSSDTTADVGDEEIVHLVNLLWASKAEAISINGFRITPQTGIKNSGSYIWVGTMGKIDPKQEIKIEAIGDKNRLSVGVNFQGNINLQYHNLVNYNVDVKTSDDIVLEKTTQTLRSDYMTTVTK